MKFTPLGPFDHTFDWEGEGFVPTDHAVKTMSRDQGIAMANHLDKSYYELMSKCKYALTPAGDATWYAIHSTHRGEDISASNADIMRSVTTRG